MQLGFRHQLIITLIDKAVIGGLLALAAFVFNRSIEKLRGNYAFELHKLTTDQSQKLEQFKNTLAAEGESLRNVRLAVAELVKRLAAANHSICWVCWIAEYTPENLRSSHLTKYNEELHLLLSEIVGARVALAALSKTIHNEFSSLINDLYALDAEMGTANDTYKSSSEEGLKKFAELYDKSRQFDAALLEKVTELAWKRGGLTKKQRARKCNKHPIGILLAT